MIRTLAIRMDRSMENALLLAEWLKKQPEVLRVIYPGLKEHPGYEVMQAQARGAGAMLTFDVADGNTALQLLSNVSLIEILRNALKVCPDIKVAGIAGPGDTLATDDAIRTFRLIKEEFPQLLRCMSTLFITESGSKAWKAQGS